MLKENGKWGQRWLLYKACFSQDKCCGFINYRLGRIKGIQPLLADLNSLSRVTKKILISRYCSFSASP